MNLIKKTKSFIQSVKSFNELRQFFSGAVGSSESSSRPTRPYAQSELVYACVHKLIDAINGLPMFLSTTDNKIVEAGPAYDFLFNNPSIKFEDLVTQVVGHYALSRDVFIVFTEMKGLQPSEMMVVSGMQMHAVTHNRQPDGQLVRWEFRGINGERAIFQPSEVYQIKNFNPYSRFHGLGPVTAARLAISQSYQASLLNESALANGADLGTVLTSPNRLEPDQARALLNQFETRHQGAGKAKRTAILSGGLDVKKAASKLADIEMAKLKDMSDKRICTAFGVPPAVVGLETEAQYSQGPAQRDFVSNSVVPMARLIAGHITNLISGIFKSGTRAVEFKDCDRMVVGPRPLNKRVSYRLAFSKALQRQSKVFAWFDTDSHPVMQEMQNEKTEKILKFQKLGITMNNLIQVHDLPYDEQPWGDEHFMSMGMVPARYILEAGLEGITGPSAPEGGGDPDESKFADIAAQLAKQVNKKSDEQRRLRIWRNWVTSWAGLEKEYKEAMRRTFVRQQRILSKKLKDAFDDSKSVTKDAREIITRVVFDLKFENDKIKVINQAFFDKASELGIRQSLTEIAGMAGDELDQVVEDVKRRTAIRTALTRSSHKLIKINQFTQKKVAAQLTAGLENGEGLNDLTDRIRELFTGKMGRARALRIARSQTATAVGAGRHEGMKQAGVERKGWLSSRDDHVRPAHRSAEQQYKGGIPVDQPFNVGGEMLMYPADPAGSAANIINCRCLQIAVAAKGKAFDLKFYANVKFYSYDDMNKAG